MKTTVSWLWNTRGFVLGVSYRPGLIKQLSLWLGVGVLTIRRGNRDAIDLIDEGLKILYRNA